MSADAVRVAELFAGVGGFRRGLEGEDFEFVWSNQYEPGEKAQWASRIYVKHFGEEGHSNDNIHDFTFPIDGIADIPDHDLLVGGFPCQDYSVARTISGELGIKGEKGKLWVDIARIIRWKRPRPKVVLLENVPRLLNSPANARGLNFAIILNDLIGMGYEVEWRVINAADYGMPQQRSRVFILAYRTPGLSRTDRQSKINGPLNFGARKKIRGPMSKWMLGKSTSKAASNWEVGPFAEAFECNGELDKKPEELPPFDHPFNTKSSRFGNAGYAWKSNAERPRKNMMWTTKVKADYDGERRTLGDPDILVKDHDPKYEIDPERLDEWRYAKSTKNEFRLRKRDRENADSELLERYDECMSAPFGERRTMWMDEEWRTRFKAAVGEDSFYHYDEGSMGFDELDSPSRTMVTAEIGSTPSRMRHIIEYEEGKYRRLMPIEAERLNMFPDNWTNIPGINDSRRGFLMGNALVVGVIERLRKPLLGILEREDD
jgi:DNA (cytosine-5)-methyltransferase 1